MAGILPDERRRNYLSRAIGALGEIQFECSSELVRTFKDYKRESKARYATHNLLMKKPALEYLGADAGEISFSMTLSASLGINPTEEANKLRKLCEAGQALPLIIGSEVIGDLWVIESVNETAQAYDGEGHSLLTEVDVRLKEYGDGI